MLNYSRQRECIKNNLANRCDHPTAEMVFQDIQKEYPRISLGTVYRNLTLLSSIGEIQIITNGLGPDRFDADPTPHSHFTCKNCGQVRDLPIKNQEKLNEQAAIGFTGKIETSKVHFYGLCPSCLNQNETHTI